MSYQEIAVLSEELKASLKGKAIVEPYRAVLVTDSEGKYIIKIEQDVRGNWVNAGQWFLKTLLFSWPMNLDNKPSDSLCLDGGQQWDIDSGLRAALLKAIEII